MDTSKQQYPSSMANSLPGLPNLDQNDLSQILKIFQKYNLKVRTLNFELFQKRWKINFCPLFFRTRKESEEIFKRELNKKVNESSDPSQKDKDFYFDVYGSLHKFVESTKDYKVSSVDSREPNALMIVLIQKGVRIYQIFLSVPYRILPQ